MIFCDVYKQAFAMLEENIGMEFSDSEPSEEHFPEDAAEFLQETQGEENHLGFSGGSPVDSRCGEDSARY